MHFHKKPIDLIKLFVQSRSNIHYDATSCINSVLFVPFIFHIEYRCNKGVLVDLLKIDGPHLLYFPSQLQSLFGKILGSVEDFNYDVISIQNTYSFKDSNSDDQADGKDHL